VGGVEDVVLLSVLPHDPDRFPHVLVEPLGHLGLARFASGVFLGCVN